MTILSPLKNVFADLLDIVYPRKCAICNSISPQSLCEKCMPSVVYIVSPFCLKCGRQLPQNIKFNSDCKICRNEYFKFSMCRSVMQYNETAESLIKKFKYQGKRNIAPFLVDLIFGYFNTADENILAEKRFDIVTSVPLHVSKQKQRGYNQAQVLALEIADRLKIPYDDILNRVRATDSQTGKNKKDRKTNVKKAFKVISTKKEKIVGTNILLIDDVFTTGSTVNECSKTLLYAKANSVTVLTLARRDIM